MNESFKILKRFALTCLLCLCFVAMLCGGALVQSNTRRLSLGTPGQQVGFLADRQTVTLQSGGRTVRLPALGTALYWARLAPAPLGLLITIGQAVREAVAP
ncbi:MAG: hypothetical protein LBB50_04310 [Oscillospiraceae bacterium]|jgi:hypothetical protein|nr:hypothetical protein [Oscillospiraceae bacterium]